MNDGASQLDAGPHPFGRPLGLVLIVAYKSIWGLVELAAGLALLFSKRLIANELAEDPQDLFINWLLSHVHVNERAAISAGALLVVLAIVKLILAAGIWSRSWRFRNAALIFFSLVAVYGSYHLLSKFNALNLLALLADVFIVFYLWKVLPDHLSDP